MAAQADALALGRLEARVRALLEARVRALIIERYAAYGVERIEMTDDGIAVTLRAPIPYFTTRCRVRE